MVNSLKSSFFFQCFLNPSLYFVNFAADFAPGWKKMRSFWMTSRSWKMVIKKGPLTKNIHFTAQKTQGGLDRGPLIPFFSTETTFF